MICLRSALSVSRSISTWIQDSTRESWGRAVAGPCASQSGPRISISLPVMSRRTTTCGWITTWMPRLWRESSLVTESTRKGMSSVTTSTTEWLEVQPFSSTVGVCTRTFAVPCGRFSASR